MESKKAGLKRTLEQIRELFEDAKKIESAVEGISSEKDFEQLSLTGNVIINSLVTKLTDVDNSLLNVYSKPMKRKREKILNKNQPAQEKDKVDDLECEDASTSDHKPVKKTKQNKTNDKEITESPIDENAGNNLPKGLVENGNPNPSTTAVKDSKSDEISKQKSSKPSSNVESHAKKIQITNNDKPSSKKAIIKVPKIKIAKNNQKYTYLGPLLTMPLELLGDAANESGKKSTQVNVDNVQTDGSEKCNDDKSESKVPEDENKKPSVKKSKKDKILGKEVQSKISIDDKLDTPEDDNDSNMKATGKNKTQKEKKIKRPSKKGELKTNTEEKSTVNSKEHHEKPREGNSDSSEDEIVTKLKSKRKNDKPQKEKKSKHSNKNESENDDKSEKKKISAKKRFTKLRKQQCEKSDENKSDSSEDEIVSKTQPKRKSDKPQKEKKSMHSNNVDLELNSSENDDERSAKKTTQKTLKNKKSVKFNEDQVDSSEDDEKMRKQKSSSKKKDKKMSKHKEHVKNTHEDQSDSSRDACSEDKNGSKKSDDVEMDNSLEMFKNEKTTVKENDKETSKNKKRSSKDNNKATSDSDNEEVDKEKDKTSTNIDTIQENTEDCDNIPPEEPVQDANSETDDINSPKDKESCSKNTIEDSVISDSDSEEKCKESAKSSKNIDAMEENDVDSHASSKEDEAEANAPLKKKSSADKVDDEVIIEDSVISASDFEESNKETEKSSQNIETLEENDEDSHTPSEEHEEDANSPLTEKSTEERVDEDTIEESGIIAEEADKDVEKDKDMEKSLEKIVEISDKDGDSSHQNNEKDTSLFNDTTILLNNSELAEINTEPVDNTTEPTSEFPIPADKLTQVIDSFLLSNSENTKSKEPETNCEKEATAEETIEDTLLSDSVILTTEDPSLVVIDDGSEDEAKNNNNASEQANLVGKIRVVALGKLLTNSAKTDAEDSSKELPQMPKIRVASFARVPKSDEEVSPKRDKLEKTSKKKNKDKYDTTLNERRLRNPEAQKRLDVLKMLEDKHKQRLERNKERLVKEKEELKATHKLNRKAKKNKRKARENEDSDKTESKRRREKKSSSSTTVEMFVIANNPPILVLANDNVSADGSIDYSVAKPEELEDKKFLDKCYVRLSARQTPEQLQLEYSIRQRREEEEKEVLDVSVAFENNDDDGDADHDHDDVASDGDSDSSSRGGGAMVSGAGAVGRRRPVRSCNAQPSASSASSSRNSSVSARGQRSTRNAKPIVERAASESSADEADSSDVEEVAQEDEPKARGRGREAKRRNDDKARKADSKVKRNGSSKKVESSDGDDDSGDSDADARSHVSISSGSELESKKKSSRNKIVVKKEKPSKRSKSSNKHSDDSDEEECDSDTVPLTKLPDSKLKKGKNVSDDSEDFEPVKKKDKKNIKKEDSDAESESDDSISTKKKAVNKRGAKKKRLVSDSEENEYSDSDGIESIKSSDSEKKEKEKPKKQRRKRIKRVNDDSSDDSSNDKSKKGKKYKDLIDTRKHIRNIIGKQALNQSTIDAEQEESDRKQRIADKQKRYNDIYNPNELESAVLDKVVLDIDEDTHEEILAVDKSLVKHLKPHQAKGIQFMWNACYESLDMIDGKGSGCILAHCMGLGKTLQVIALIHTLILNSDTTKTDKVLVVCPLSTVLNWVSEFNKWLKDEQDFEVYEIVSNKQISDRQNKIEDWHKHGGVMIMGYDMFRNLSNPDNKRINKRIRTTFVKGLVDPGPDLVICDEGHLLKNEKTSTSIAMNRIRTLRRIVLTGTPLQNNLKEYFCMVQFVKPNLLGTYKEYLNRFVNPITNGQYTDSTPHDIQIMRKRSHVLHKLLDGIVQRRDYAVLAPYLPPKHEYVIFVTLQQKQINLYEHYLNVIAPMQRTQSTKGVSLFKDFQEFQRICTHPRVLLDKSVQDQMAKWKEDEECETDGTEGSLKDFLDDDDEDEAKSTSSDSSNSSSSSIKSDERKRPKKKPRPPPVARTTRAVAAEKGIDVATTSNNLEVANTGSEWWREFANDETLNDLMCSSKLALLFEILHQCEIIGDKVLIFSQSLYSLTIIEYFLSKIDDAAQMGDCGQVGGYSSSWSLGLDYFRLDGSSSCDNRANWCKTFNNPKNTRARLFLISTRAGGLGINLVAANRVIIFDVSWNPSHDIQSIYRVYRFGQNKPSYIYRFVSNGTMEMKVYERQVTKQAISKRVIDEQQIDRHYNQNDLAELYKFEPKPEVRPIPPVPKDVLLGELVHDKADLIYKYHEHHTLLENKEDEELNEEERKAAWDEFENEKKMRQMPAHINNIPIHSIMLGLANYLKREHPDWTPVQIQAAVPASVQEMQEKMLLGDVALYNSMILELRNLQQQQQQLQQQRMQDYYRLQQQNQERMLLERHRQLMQNNATVSYLQRLYANATANNLSPEALRAFNANLAANLGNRQSNNTNPPQIIETVELND